MSYHTMFLCYVRLSLNGGKVMMLVGSLMKNWAISHPHKLYQSALHNCCCFCHVTIRACPFGFWKKYFKSLASEDFMVCIMCVHFFSIVYISLVWKSKENKGHKKVTFLCKHSTIQHMCLNLFPCNSLNLHCIVITHLGRSMALLWYGSVL